MKQKAREALQIKWKGEIEVMRGGEKKERTRGATVDLNEAAAVTESNSPKKTLHINMQISSIFLIEIMKIWFSFEVIV